MCGIFAFLTKRVVSRKDIYMSGLNISHRGQDETRGIHGKHLDYSYNLIFHRLAINGMTPESGQPLFYPAKCDTKPYIYMMCNGEIYNHRELVAEYNLECDSDSDCEVIIHLYRKIGFMQTLKSLRGVFAIVLLDLYENRLFIGRDPYGVRGLMYYINENNSEIIVASELKSILPLVQHSNPINTYYNINEFPPGSGMEYYLSDNKYSLSTYYSHNPRPMSTLPVQDLKDMCRKLLEQAITRRLMCDRKLKDGSLALGAYLSGGFDSSFVAAYAQTVLKQRGLGKLKTFSIGFKGSPDLEKANQVAEHIGSDHHSYVVTKDEMLDSIPEVVRQLETYDTTTIRAGSFMYVLTKFINRDFPDLAVLLSGEGADESSGSYMYFHNAPDNDAFHDETYRLLKDICYFDARRGDRASAAHNKEIRVPFLDIDFLQLYGSVPPFIKTCDGIEKHLLRSIAEMYFNLLPKDIIWRPKEAMSDGVSVHTESWYQVIQNSLTQHYSGCTPLDKEKNWYLSLFNNNYPGCTHIIPYYWKPKWSKTEDPSARLLDTYRK